MSEKKLRSNHTPKAKWSYKEDQRLIEAVNKYGFIKWNEIAKYVGECRNGKQCRERWLFNLSPDINNAPWDREEDEKLIKLHGKYGNKWATISRYLEGRSAIKVKNRMKTLSKKMCLECNIKPHEEKPKPIIIDYPKETHKIYDAAFDFSAFDNIDETFPENFKFE
ncbi:Myb-like DNA-binding domain containing protein [Trichomonas vaginalis G3]|uniref:Myb-like DNA-binding domain containing protein n=1 Tax=Trichomonas vaginalis (strain ATCC PRA-98 / G3) TaxID=412133 RepID=A2DBS5_TRIV3|nr:RNA polymerase II transcription regulator recruiting protein [Trichomonas vaginalis G3]EAY22278.1 Myb-like DNA-binding domain containing protein [Trichomonas vaginalis G3]KAI5533251.1 RNA polymerase II transcription regulator recruiting protein [Trichomonas vaginalis G3]|eukprot:XP_001583264.1 Myb-like DNA-binding domain containing protein [Trichomonas vaginalis G3]